MAGPLFANNAVGTLAAGYSAGATALTLTAGQGARFPSPGVDQWFTVTIVDVSNNIEIVRVTNRTADTFTVLRGQEGTTARALGLGEKVEHRLTAGDIDAIRDKDVITAQIPDGAITEPKIGFQAVNSEKLAINSVYGVHIVAATVTADKLALNAARDSLGFDPVQQGGGIDQVPAKIRLGWSSAGKLKTTVDVTDTGFLLNERQDGDPRTAGYRGKPPNIQNNDYVFGLSDMDCCVHHGIAGDHVYYIPSDAVPFQIGATIQIKNHGGGLIIVEGQTFMLLRWVPTGADGGRSLIAPGVCWIEKVDANAWWIYGHGLA